MKLKKPRSKRNTKTAINVDPITLEVVRMRLEAIVEEMGATMLRTAHSTIFYESRDFSVALLDVGGDLVAMGQFIPHHQGGMQSALKSILVEKGTADMKQGDIYLTNDAYAGGTHTQDLNMFMPIFHGSELIMFCGSTAHQIDIGGMVVGSYCVGATSIFQEGVRFPRIKIGENGEIFDDFMRTFQTNVRLPDQEKGDVLAMLASLKVAAISIKPLLDRYSAKQFTAILTEVLNVTERRVRAELSKIPRGTYKFVDYIDHDGVNDEVYKMKVALTFSGDEVIADFTGTAPQAEGFINASYWNTLASTYAGFFLFLDPEIPRNAGFFRPIQVVAPKGTLLNPVSPAPIGASTTECGGRVYDLVIGALSKAVPDKALGTWSMMWLGVCLSGNDPGTGEPYIHWILDGLGTGGGARVKTDGMNATCIAASNVLIPYVEIEEDNYPIRYLRREIKANSGGPGRQRGGCALETELQVETDCQCTVLGSRFERAPAQGIHGGKSGMPSAVYRKSNNKKFNIPAKATGVSFNAGDHLVLRACGGGGLGNPRLRKHEDIKKDLELGYVTKRGIKRDYGSDK